MKIQILLPLMFVASLASANPFDNNSSSSPSNTDSFPLDTVIWPSTNIPVCWEDASKNPILQGEVETAVTQQWESNSLVDFTGWEQCPTTSFPGVRIGVDDIGPHVKYMGKDLAGQPNGMILNFTYNNWGASCASNITFCTQVIAIHEFGHVLGFAHEQNRDDTPATCTYPAQGTSGNVIFTDWDIASVMNYCNPSWNGDGNLSIIDIMTVQTYYGNIPSYDINSGRLEIANISVGSSNYSAILDFNNSAGNFTLTSLTTAELSSQVANYDGATASINIPLLKVMNNNHVVSLYSASLNYNENVFSIANATKIQPTPIATIAP